MKKNYFDKRVAISTFDYEPCKQKFKQTTCIEELEDCDGDAIITETVENKSFVKQATKTKIINTGKETIVIIQHDINGQPRTFKGTASCCRKDSYDVKKGIQIAYNRAKIKALEAELEELCE